MSAEQKKYNGWANRATWNVALWIGNDEGLYSLARESENYGDFVERIGEMSPAAIGYETPDKISWNDSALDIEELDALITDLRS